MLKVLCPKVDITEHGKLYYVQTKDPKKSYVQDIGFLSVPEGHAIL